MDHNHTKMDSPDDHVSQDIWDIVNSWITEPVSLNVTPVQSYDDDDDHHNHGNVASNGGDEGTSTMVQGMENVCGTRNQRPEDQLPLQVVWPSAINPGSCSSCQVLREIILTNGTHTTKLEIHGIVGVIFHAIHCYNYGLAASDDYIQNYQMLDFSRQSFEEIKEYLEDYIEEHRQHGYTLLQEPLSLFYETLCTGYAWLNFDRHVSDNSGGTFEQGETSNPSNLVPQQLPMMFRTELAIQRERIKKMKLEDLSKYFDMTINDASEKLRLCTTVIKRKLRSYDIERWPYRKVNSLKKKIASLKEKKGADYKKLRKGSSRHVTSEIQKLEQQLLDILSGKLMPL